ncbi:MAG: hypothetical protein ABIQ32_05410 [Sphingomicrobium sp.]
MMKQMTIVAAAAVLIGAQQAPLVAPGKVLAIGPKQDDPRALCGAEGSVKTPERGIIVQGGLKARGALAIGPKQDDPRAPALARAGDDNDPKASGGTASSGNVLAIGPKQDDPRAPGTASSFNPDTDPAARSGCVDKKKD